jgi:hypothetical protein
MEYFDVAQAHGPFLAGFVSGTQSIASGYDLPNHFH